MRKLKPLSLVALVLSLWASALVPGAEAAEIQISLEAVDGVSQVSQGKALHFDALYVNDSGISQTLDVTFDLVEIASGRRQPVERWTEVVLAGSNALFRGRIASSTWFAEEGAFRIEVRSDDPDVTSQPLSFEVVRSRTPVPRFKDTTSQVGIDSTLGGWTCGNWAAGAAWADVDLDGNLDLFQPRRDLPSHLWMSNGKTFVDEAAARGVDGAGSSGVALGAVFADFDNDGDQDLYVNVDGPNRLYANDGTGTFEEIATAAGVADDGPSQSASWGDYDSDGLLDLYVTNHARCTIGDLVYFDDHLYHNEGDGTFTDQTALLNVEGATTGAGFQASWFDYDDDGDVDLYLGNDFYGPSGNKYPNVLWRNEGLGVDGQWRFVNISRETGTGLPLNSMGLGVGDYDRDMDLDLAVSNIRAPYLFNNDDGHRFFNRAKEAGIARDRHDAASIAITWGTEFFDANNDGWLDLYFASGRLNEGEFDLPQDYQPNELFTNAHDGTFLDHSAPSGANDDESTRGVALADFDRDGRVDLFVVNLEGSPRLFRNVTPRGERHWLEVDTIGRSSNKDGCGARLILKPRKDKPARLLRQVFCGGTSLATGSDSVVHFGVNNIEGPLYKLVIEWPSGKRQVKKWIRADRLIAIREPPG